MFTLRYIISVDIDDLVMRIHEDFFSLISISKSNHISSFCKHLTSLLSQKKDESNRISSTYNIMTINNSLRDCH